MFPGFRSNVKWKKIVGIIVYVLMAFYAAGSIMQSLPDVRAFFMELVSLLLLGMAFLAGSNFAGWDRKILPFRKLPKEICIAIRVIICVLFFSCAMAVDDYVRYAILKSPRSN